ncbi:MAG: response regulator transcription factor [Nitrospira sp.]|nr:response regulator transcription factor [Nitrospira sp.]
MMAMLVMVGGVSREAQAIMLFPLGGADQSVIAVQPISPFLPGFSMDVLDSPASPTVDLRSRSPIAPVSPSPSSGVLFVTTLLGVLGVAAHGGVFTQGARYSQQSAPHPPPPAGAVIVLSHDGAFARGIEEQLHRAGYAVRVATAVSELLAIPNCAAPALVLVDQRIQDWDMLRTDPCFRHVLLMAVVPLGAIYPDENCLSDLERGMDGVHDLRDGYRLLVAKVGAYLRRARGSRLHRGIYQVGAVEFDSDSHEVTIAGQPVHLSAKPLAILEALVQEPEKIFTRRELSALLWGPNFAVCGHTLDVHVHALRRQLARDPDRLCRLVTIKGVGFKLKSVSLAGRTPRGAFVRDQNRVPIRPHHRRRLRLSRHGRRNRTTNPRRLVEVAAGGASPIRWHMGDSVKHVKRIS